MPQIATDQNDPFLFVVSAHANDPWMGYCRSPGFSADEPNLLRVYGGDMARMPADILVIRTPSEIYRFTSAHYNKAAQAIVFTRKERLVPQPLPEAIRPGKTFTAVGMPLIDELRPAVRDEAEIRAKIDAEQTTRVFEALDEKDS